MKDVLEAQAPLSRASFERGGGGGGRGGVWPAHPPPLSLHTKTVPMSCRVVLQYLFSLTFVATLRTWRHIRSTSPNVLSLFCPTNSANANSVNVSRKMLHHTTNSKLVKCFRAAFAAGTSFKTLKMARKWPLPCSPGLPGAKASSRPPTPGQRTPWPPLAPDLQTASFN